MRRSPSKQYLRRQDLRATDMKLTELRDSLESQGIPTLLDIRGIIDSSVPPDVTLLDCNLKQVRFDWALRWLLKQPT